MTESEPVCIETFKRGILRERVSQARRILKACTLCPRRCGINRLAGETGICKTGEKAWVSSYGPHFGEESPLVGDDGSGTIFFTHCNLMCVFCQNYDISHKGEGNEATAEQLAQIMVALQSQGCHNINLVTPSHVVPQILEALEIAIPEGLRLPLVFNTGGYDRVETLRLLDGVVDIYMPDFKFWNPDIAGAACDAADYPAVARNALTEMHRQVGDLVIDPSGIARRGLLIRHLVLPGGLAGTREVMRFIATRISRESYVNIMSQYRPCGRAASVPGLGEFPTREDYDAAVQAAREEGIHRLDTPRRVFVMG
ncbi:radical SAM protein [Desulfonema ishimotonii]|uniref:Radical SAM protein n=1 Tax=Desulfonema ishimotonii TaxID=45657 RepID=A0A401G244_9BACT|nr:radical SAM protein [Desulfonema ishimotonii]GBC63275.1 radical SAM protein [Desulfonema ishimotonii]